MWWINRRGIEPYPLTAEFSAVSPARLEAFARGAVCAFIVFSRSPVTNTVTTDHTGDFVVRQVSHRSGWAYTLHDLDQAAQHGNLRTRDLLAEHDTAALDDQERAVSILTADPVMHVGNRNRAWNHRRRVPQEDGLTRIEDAAPQNPTGGGVRAERMKRIGLRYPPWRNTGKLFQQSLSCHWGAAWDDRQAALDFAEKDFNGVAVRAAYHQTVIAQH